MDRNTHIKVLNRGTCSLTAEVFEIFGCMFLASVGEPTRAILCLAWDQAVFCVGNRAEELASTVVLMSLGAAVGLVAENLIEDESEVLG